MAFVNIEQAEFWSQLAPTWLELEDQLEEVGRLPGEVALDRLGLLPGQKVVDLGCGSGTTTLELAARVGPGGEVVGVDISAEMLERARERAARAGAGNVEFVHADVQVHDLGEGRFDAAYSRFGVMFFADPVAAFANVRRALRSGAIMRCRASLLARAVTSRPPSSGIPPPGLGVSAAAVAWCGVVVEVGHYGCCGEHAPVAGWGRGGVGAGGGPGADHLRE